MLKNRPTALFSPRVSGLPCHSSSNPLSMSCLYSGWANTHAWPSYLLQGFGKMFNLSNPSNPQIIFLRLTLCKVTPEPTPRSSSSCWFPDTYCRPSPSNLVDTGEATTAADCQEECENTEGCNFFTFLRHRGSPQCSLLSSCTRYQECGFLAVKKAAETPSGRHGAMLLTVVFPADQLILHIICEYLFHSIALLFETHFSMLVFQSRISYPSFVKWDWMIVNNFQG